MSCQKVVETLEAFDGLELYCESYTQPQAKGVIIAVHDYGEHSGLYRPVFERMAGDGYLVYTLDLRGHGKSPGDRAFIAAFDHYLDDLDLLLARVRDREAELAGNIFILGQGLGALIAARFGFTRKPRIRGLILCGLLTDLPLSRLERSLVRYSFHLFPHAPFADHSRAEWLGPIVDGPWRDDQLVFRGPLRLNTVREIIGACSELRSEAHQIPFALLSIVGRHMSSEAARLIDELYDLVMASDKNMLRYEKIDQHVLLHPERDQVVGDIIEWCDQQRILEPQAVVLEDDTDEDDSL
jgi:acylglycerol lipase